MSKEPTSYISITTRLPRYLPYAEFLLQMDLSLTAKLIYTMLLDRTTLSQKNGWADENGNVFVIYTMEDLCAVTGKCISTIKAVLNDLTEAGLIEKTRGGYSAPSRIYVKLPPYGQKTDHHTARKLTVTGSENWPLTTKYNKPKVNNVFTGQKNGQMPIPDYNCEEGASL